MKATALDHLVLTVRDIEATVGFFCGVLGMEKELFRPADGTERVALKFGAQKINLHLAGAEFEPKADRPTPGSGDLCFLTETPLAEWVARFEANGVDVEIGPVARTGATGPLMSIYVRDPDGNLIEVSVRG
ncbi:MAG: VOC family protein [Rhodobacter sp.]|nr:VOC family protein [Rhodobacter sp.]